MASLHILSGGAANSLVNKLQAQFQQQTGLEVAGTFSAVGQMKEALLAGEPCDLVILTEALVGELVASGHLDGASARSLGGVPTGVGVPAGQSQPPMASPEQLAQALRQAEGIYMADPVKATAGIHFMKVLRELGLDQSLAPRLKGFPNGQTAMAAMVRDSQVTHGLLIGCTQVTEILNTPGAQLAGLLPPPLELVTPYWAAVTRRSAQAQAATQMLDLLSAPAQAELRRGCGFV